MDVFLTRDLEVWIRDRVNTGVYTSEGHLVRRALRMLREHDAQVESESEPAPPRVEMPPQTRSQAVPAK